LVSVNVIILYLLHIKKLVAKIYSFKIQNMRTLHVLIRQIMFTLNF